MKTMKQLLTVRQVLAVMLLSSLFLVVSCKDDTVEPEVGTVSATVPSFSVVNVPVTLVDKSTSAASRTWTVTGGTPATSTEKSVEVTFTEVGTSTVTLSVKFENGTEADSTFSVTVAEELNADIAFAGGDYSFALGDSDLSFTFDLSIVDEVGGADSYLWTFPAGTVPESSTDASLTGVIFSGDNPEISLTLSRSADGASITITGTLETEGPANLWATGFWDFELEGVVGMLQTWDGDIGGLWADGVVALDEGGYEGKGITVNYPGDKGYYGVISRDLHDDNAQLTKDDIVMFSFYAKSNSGTPEGFARIVNHLPSWSIPDPALAQNYQYFGNVGFDGIGTEWTKVSIIDTLDYLETATADNVFPEIGFSGAAQSMSLDKVELKLLGNTND
jgi:PKD repeat protein